MSRTDLSITIRRGEPNSPLCNMFRNELLNHITSLPGSKTLRGPAVGDKDSPRPMTLPSGSIFLYAETGPEAEPVPFGSLCLIPLYATSQNYRGLPTELEVVGEIKRTIVLETHRKTGVAKKLIQAVEQVAKDEMGLKYIVVETSKELKAAQMLYQKAGYRNRDVFGAYVPDESRCYEKWL